MADLIIGGLGFGAILGALLYAPRVQRRARDRMRLHSRDRGEQ